MSPRSRSTRSRPPRQSAASIGRRGVWRRARAPARFAPCAGRSIRRFSLVPRPARPLVPRFSLRASVPCQAPRTSRAPRWTCHPAFRPRPAPRSPRAFARLRSAPCASAGTLPSRPRRPRLATALQPTRFRPAPGALALTFEHFFPYWGRFAPFFWEELLITGYPAVESVHKRIFWRLRDNLAPDVLVWTPGACHYDGVSEGCGPLETAS